MITSSSPVGVGCMPVGVECKPIGGGCMPMGVECKPIGVGDWPMREGRLRGSLER